MSKDDCADDMLLNIQDDNLDEFVKNAKTFENWQEFLLADEQEYFIHYAISKNI